MSDVGDDVGGEFDDDGEMSGSLLKRMNIIEVHISYFFIHALFFFSLVISHSVTCTFTFSLPFSTSCIPMYIFLGSMFIFIFLLHII